MTKLEQLIKELCPNGVEYKRFDDMCDIITKQTGFDYTNTIKDSLKREKSPNSLPYIQTKFFTGKNFDFETDYYIPTDVAENYSKILLDRKCILLSIVGASIGNVGLFSGEHKAFLGGAICVAKPKQEYNIDFLYYYLTSHQGQKQIFRKIKGAGQATVTIEDIREFQIPVPPLEVQAEIVKILDEYSTSVTALQQELEKELTARKKQYEYYREQILSEIKNAKMCELQEIVAEDCSISYGIVQTGDDVEDGVPVVRPVDLTSKIVSLNGLKKVSSSISDSYKRTVLKGGDLLVCVRGTTGVISIAAEELNGCNVSRGIVPLTFKDDICKDYVYYQLIGNAIQETIQAKTKGTALKQINMEDLRHILIPIPPIEEQERIASILDRFDKLCNDISEGLPAEIEARRKQYEYYRDKLLSFEEVRV